MMFRHGKPRHRDSRTSFAWGKAARLVLVVSWILFGKIFQVTAEDTPRIPDDVMEMALAPEAERWLTLHPRLFDGGHVLVEGAGGEPLALASGMGSILLADDGIQSEDAAWAVAEQDALRELSICIKGLVLSSEDKEWYVTEPDGRTVGEFTAQVVAENASLINGAVNLGWWRRNGGNDCFYLLVFPPPLSERDTPAPAAKPSVCHLLPEWRDCIIASGEVHRGGVAILRDGERYALLFVGRASLADGEGDGKDPTLFQSRLRLAEVRAHEAYLRYLGENVDSRLAATYVSRRKADADGAADDAFSSRAILHMRNRSARTLSGAALPVDAGWWRSEDSRFILAAKLMAIESPQSKGEEEMNR